MSSEIQEVQTEAKNKEPEQILKTEILDEKKMNSDTHLTLSTKLSTDQLICKTPQENSSSSSPNGSLKSLKRIDGVRCSNFESNWVLYLGCLQLVFGFLMTVFGVLIIVHDASLAQIGGGIWGGCLAMTTGLTGILTAAQKFCPLKPRAQKIAHTVFLALSLINLAIAQLVVVLAATGLARDVNKVKIEEEGGDEVSEPTTIQPGKISIILPSNYQCLLFNVGLLIAAFIECICAALSAYKSSRLLCPCFKRNDDRYRDNLNLNSHALVSSWLGKQPPASHIYFVGPPSTLSNGRKVAGGFPIGTQLYALPPPLIQPQLFGYPLIPAPLGPVPSPIIPPPSRREMMHKIHKKYKSKCREPTPSRSRSKSRSKSKEKQISEKDVARTYTGLDRTIAEEFIDICDLKNASLCSDVSCSNSSCQSPSCDDAGCNTNSDAASQDYLVNNNNKK